MVQAFLGSYLLFWWDNHTSIIIVYRTISVWAFIDFISYHWWWSKKLQTTIMKMLTVQNFICNSIFPMCNTYVNRLRVHNKVDKLNWSKSYNQPNNGIWLDWISKILISQRGSFWKRWHWWCHDWPHSRLVCPLTCHIRLQCCYYRPWYLHRCPFFKKLRGEPGYAYGRPCIKPDSRLPTSSCRLRWPSCTPWLLWSTLVIPYSFITAL